jgi:hypothetical protein
VPHLDRDEDDDRLVAAALTDDGGARVVLFSADFGPFIRARVSGLDAYEPLAAWRLPEQADSESAELAKLRREVAELKAQRPESRRSFRTPMPMRSSGSRSRPCRPCAPKRSPPSMLS